ncbi:MAG: hypothetical protein IJ700_02515 [Bacteroidaceae bacterium]|nr:hypothetical protein [Bacteroidaceae bacterium]
MEIKFTIAKRGTVPAEGGEIRLQPRLEKRPTVNAVEFQRGPFRLPSSLSSGELAHALDDLRRVMLHEMEKGNAVTLPGIGTFRLSLKGGIEVKDGNYHGRDVHVAGINFQPDRELLSRVKGFEVSQVPYGQAIRTDDEDVEQRLTALFADHEAITHKDVRFAFELTLTPHRVTSLLQRLVREGRLIRIGDGAQTRYRPAPGHFGR